MPFRQFWAIFQPKSGPVTCYMLRERSVVILQYIVRRLGAWRRVPRDLGTVMIAVSEKAAHGHFASGRSYAVHKTPVWKYISCFVPPPTSSPLTIWRVTTFRLWTQHPPKRRPRFPQAPLCLISTTRQSLIRTDTETQDIAQAVPLKSSEQANKVPQHGPWIPQLDISSSCSLSS